MVLFLYFSILEDRKYSEVKTRFDSIGLSSDFSYTWLRDFF
jgi:hypothetical protein